MKPLRISLLGRLLGLWCGASLWILLDHLSKVWVQSKTTELPFVLTSFLNIVYVKNRGISFGLFQAGSGLQVAFLCVLSLSIVVGLSIWYMRARDPLLRGGLICIVGGAVGNVVDRVLWGGVVDFIDCHLWGVHFPAFNLADACVTCGAGLVFLSQLRAKEEEKKEKK